MTGAADSQNPAAGAVDAPARSAARAAAGIGRRAWEQFAENPLQAIFGTAVVALLVFNFTTFNARIDDTNARIGDTNARIDRVEARMDARFTALEARIDRVETRIDRVEARIARVEEGVSEINLKLTALIAALNRTEEVEAALEGRLIDPAPVPVPSATSPFPP